MSVFIDFMLKDQWSGSDVDLEVGVMDTHGIHALVFPVRKSGSDWVDASTKKPIDVQPTHWRKWPDGG